MKILSTAKNLAADRRGVTAVEYGLIAALVAAGLVTSIGLLTGGLSTAFTTIQSALTSA